MLSTILFAAVLQSSDLYRLRSVSSVAISPDASRVAYTIERNEKVGRAKPQLDILDVSSKKSIAVDDGSDPVWSPDGAWLAFEGKDGLAIVRADGTGVRTLAKTEGTNGPIPMQ